MRMLSKRNKKSKYDEIYSPQSLILRPGSGVRPLADCRTTDQLTFLILVSRIALVSPDRSKQIETILVRMAQSGQLRGRVTEEQLIDLLDQVSLYTLPSKNHHPYCLITGGRSTGKGCLQEVHHCRELPTTSCHYCHDLFYKFEVSPQKRSR